MTLGPAPKCSFFKCRVVRKRFDDELIAYLLDLKWWDWEIEKIEANFEALSSGDLTLIRKIDK